MIEEGSRVRHKKYGLGTVMKYYPKNDGVRVEYDSGHKTVNARKKLTPVTETSAEKIAEVSDQARSVKVSRRSTAGSASVDYKALSAARDFFQKLCPDADKILPKIYGSRIYCEIWRKDGTAKCVFLDEAKGEPAPAPKKRGKRARLATV